jgi:ergothioneine biosynthesis protein EgtB
MVLAHPFQPLGPADETFESPVFSGISERFRKVRKETETLCKPLETEDYGLQCAEHASPPKWHLAHTTWFFETFILLPRLRDYRSYDSRYHALFNSYYQSLGEPFERAHRGDLSRPTVAQVYAYRRHVDLAMGELLSGRLSSDLVSLVEWGLQHEQQHQELLLMDIQYNLSRNPLRPAYAERLGRPEPQAHLPLQWVPFSGGERRLGYEGMGFAFDNERPRHPVHLAPYALADRPVNCGEYLVFMEYGGYDRPELWLSDGWEVARREGWRAPLYWEKRGEEWWRYTLRGMTPVDAEAPLCHVSFYEADAFARWASRRLPTEAEWENASFADAEARPGLPASANLLESGLWQPRPAPEEEAGTGLRQMFGDTWEWTQSAYSAYPGYETPRGALGEYNGKFMNNQRVLRGGSCVTPASHIRPTYRNFFRPEDRWAFTGVRLCQSLPD